MGPTRPARHAGNRLALLWFYHTPSTIWIFQTRPSVLLMGVLYEQVIRRVLFRSDAESAHERAIAWLKLLMKVRPLANVMAAYNRPGKNRPVECFGLTFPNPVGLAAGFDKNAEVWPVMPALGFGFVEVGTVTHLEQPGNQRPRLFRLPEHEALINRMGFNNEGAEAIAERFKRSSDFKKRKIPVGINIGKSKVVSLEQAAADYLASYHALADFADFFTVNVSSPNTPELRELQEKSRLRELLSQLLHADGERARKLGVSKIPFLVKIAPDLTYRQVDDVLEVVQELDMAGIVATNTMVARPAGINDGGESGGLSGRPIHEHAVDMVKYVHLATGGKLPIIGVGGIMDAKTAGQMFDAGAVLVQLYSGMVYRGPFFPKEVVQAAQWHSAEWV